MTQAEYAPYSGLDSSYISRLISRGIIPLNRDGRIDPEIADAARRQRVGLRMPSLTKAQRLALKTPPHPWDRIDWQMRAVVAAIDRQLRYSLNFVFVAKLDEAQLRDLLCDVGQEFLRRWKKHGGAPGGVLTPGA